MAARGPHGVVNSILASQPEALVSKPSIPRIFSEEIFKLLRLIDGTVENSRLRLDNFEC